MRWVVAFMWIGVVAFAASVVYAAVQMAPEAPLVVREHPSYACIRDWNCVGPLQIYADPEGVEYGMYSCEYGVIFLRKPDLEA